MMDPGNPFLSQMAMCCGLGRRQRAGGFGLATRAQHHQGQPAVLGNYYYSPSMAHLGAAGVNTWPMGANFAAQQMAQPYLVVTQPVILAATGNPAVGPNQQAAAPGAALALVQQAQTTTAGPFQSLSIFGGTGQSASPAGGAHQQQQQQNILASQYAIYNSAMNTSVFSGGGGGGGGSITGAPQAACYEDAYGSMAVLRQRNLVRNASTFLQQTKTLPITGASFQQHHQAAQMDQRPPPAGGLNAELFKRLEMIEKQVDLSGDIELIERYGIVITRAIDPYSLMPLLTEATLRRYQTHFLPNGSDDEDYVIRFIEIIKRPGQTLGLYIRNVQIESALYGAGHREGLIITKIESDSPIYTSQVLHVGDEILSVNLVDVQGMSLDDVVIIMSIPRRLVLALRIPRERDQLLRTNLLHQQEIIRRSIEQQQQQQQPLLNISNRVTAMVATPQSGVSSQEQYFQRSPSRRGDMLEQQHQANLDSGTHPSEAVYMRAKAEQLMASRGQQAIIYNVREGFLTPQDAASSRQLGSTSGQQGQQRHLFHARPARVQSAGGLMPSSETNGETVLPEETEEEMGPVINNYHMMSQAFEPAGMSPITHRDFDQQQISKFRNQNLSSNGLSINGDNGAEATQANSGRQHTEQRPLTQMDRQMAISKSIDDSHDEGDDRFRRNFDSELASLERDAMNRDRPTGPLQQQQGSSSVGTSESSPFNLREQSRQQQQQQQQQQHHRPRLASSTLPRRELPTRPDLVSTSPPTIDAINSGGSSIKQPVISNIRLGNTPEQSSYFSSSIDAINRELKELRRQRIALGNSETSTDSTRMDL